MREFFRNIRIRDKLLIAYAGAFLVAFSVCGYIIYSQVRAIVQQSIVTELNRTTETITGMVRASVDISIRNYLRAVAEKNLDIAKQLDRQVRRGLLTEEQAKAQARRVFLSQTIGATGRVYCLNSEGIMVVNRQRGLEGVDMSSMSFVQEQMRRKDGELEYEWREPLETQKRLKTVSMVYFEPWDWIITASSYRDEIGDMVQVDDFRESLLTMGFGEGGYPFVLGYDGLMLIHPHLEGKHYSEYDNPALSAVAERIITERNGHFDYDWKNPGETKLRRKVVYYMDVPELEWVVSSSSIYEDFEGPVEAVGYVVLSGFLAAVALLAPISLGIGAVFTAQFGKLRRNFDRAAAGDFSVRMERSSADELGQLAGYFNNFMEKLAKYNDELQTEISERKKVEEELIAMDKAKTMFLSSASHELRTPLTSIIGFLKLMERNFEKQFLPRLSPDKELEKAAGQFMGNLTIVRNESDRLGLLVTDLLDLNKIESGGMQWRDQPTDAATLLKRAGDAIAAQMDEKPQIAFKLQYPLENLELNVDRDRIHQVLINLLTNAFKYTDEGEVELKAVRSKEGVKFMVCDTGRGIPPEDHDKVFDIFYQVQDENMRSSKMFGSGLGLAICREIVGHYSGKLYVESKVGQGSCFSVLLPLVERR